MTVGEMASRSSVGAGLMIWNSPSFKLPSIAGFSSDEVTAAVKAAAEKLPEGGSSTVDFVTTALNELAACRCGENAAAKLLADPEVSPFLLSQGLEDLMDRYGSEWVHLNHHPPVPQPTQSMDVLAFSTGGLFGRSSGLMYASLGIGMDEDTGLDADKPKDEKRVAYEREPSRRVEPLDRISEGSPTQAQPSVGICCGSTECGNVAPSAAISDVDPGAQ